MSVLTAFFSKSSMNMRHVSDFEALSSAKSQARLHGLETLA
jgi:hypothetical protein